MRVSEMRDAAGGLPDHEIWRLLSAATGRSRADLVLNSDLTAAESARFGEMVRRRLHGEPLQYIEGTVDFGPLELLIDARALVPRPETEQLWELVVSREAEPAPRVLVDLCSGSGNLALALKHRFPDARVMATELDPGAAVLARQNADRTGLPIEVYPGDLFAPLPPEVRGTVDGIVANPPYLAEHELAGLPVDVRDHEPRHALVAGPAGTEIVERIALEARYWLRPGGFIALEINEFMGEESRELFSEYGAELIQDLNGRDRFVLGHGPARRG